MNFWTPENICKVTGGKWLKKPVNNEPVNGISIDTREDLNNLIYAAIRGENHDGHDFVNQAFDNGASMVIVDRDFDITNSGAILKVNDVRKALADLASEYRNVLTGTCVIAITGSAGKTTTKELIHGILKTKLSGSCAVKSFNNDIGVPLTLLKAKEKDDYLVVEIGTNSPGEIASLASIVRPDIAVITTIGRAHLEGLGSRREVAKEKTSLLKFVADNGSAFLNGDIVTLRNCNTTCKTYFYGSNKTCDIKLTDRGRFDQLFWFEIDNNQRFNISMPGNHNAMNATAAVAVARRMGFDDTEIADALKDISPPPMRMTEVCIGGKVFYNDAYNANPDSMQASLLAFSELTPDVSRRILILGDMLELGETAQSLHEELGQFIAFIHQITPFDKVVFVGSYGMDVAQGIISGLSGLSGPSGASGGSGGCSTEIKLVETLSEQFNNELINSFENGDAILLKGSRRIGLEKIISEAEQRLQVSSR